MSACFPLAVNGISAQERIDWHAFLAGQLNVEQRDIARRGTDVQEAFAVGRDLAGVQRARF